jgi:hypothetical protein
MELIEKLLGILVSSPSRMQAFLFKPTTSIRVVEYKPSSPLRQPMHMGFMLGQLIKNGSEEKAQIISHSTSYHSTLLPTSQ